MFCLGWAPGDLAVICFHLANLDSFIWTHLTVPVFCFVFFFSLLALVIQKDSHKKKLQDKIPHEVLWK